MEPVSKDERRQQRREHRRRAMAAFGRYLDDLLALVGAGCLTAAAELRFGTAAALAVAGTAALVFSLVVARGRR